MTGSCGLQFVRYSSLCVVTQRTTVLYNHTMSYLKHRHTHTVFLLDAVKLGRVVSQLSFQLTNQGLLVTAL